MRQRIEMKKKSGHRSEAERSIADCLIGFLPLRTVRKRLLGPEHWRFPDFGIFSHKGNEKASEQELAWLEDAVAYEYAREFESLRLLRNKMRRFSELRQSTRAQSLNKSMVSRKQPQTPIDDQGYWRFSGTDVKSILVPKTPSEVIAQASAPSFSNGQLAAGFDAAPDFPDKPFTLQKYLSAGRAPIKSPRAVFTLKALAPGDGYNLAAGLPPPGMRYYVIAVNWECSIDDLKKREFPAWITDNAPKEKRVGLQGRAPTRVLEQSLKDLGILRLCCQAGTVSKAMKLESTTPRSYKRRDQWESACHRSILLLAQWALLVQNCASEFTRQQMAKKIKPLEVVALEVARALLVMRSAISSGGAVRDGDR